MTKPAPMPLENLPVYYRGARFASIALQNRMLSHGVTGPPIDEIENYRAMVERYAEAVRETAELRRS